MPLSESKIFAIEILDIIDDLARPEIKRTIIKKFWQYFKNRAYNVMLKKPDEEINAKFLIIHQKLSKRFKDIDSSIEINVMEKLNPGVSIPDVGELAKTKTLTTVNKDQAERLYKELF